MSQNTSVAMHFPSNGDIPEAFQLNAPLHQDAYLIGGQLRQWSGDTQEVISPIRMREGDVLREVTLGSYPLLGRDESLEILDAAIDAYDQGRGTWPTLSVEQRIAHVRDFVYRMKAFRDDVVRLLMWEIGKPLPAAEKEFDRTVEYIEDTIDALKDLDRISSRFTVDSGVLAQIRRAPLGVVLCMGPYNYPLNETFTTLIPALIMGNVVIFKPPRLGVLLHSPLLEAFRDAFPPGVVNTVYGQGQQVIAPLMESGKVDVLAFIGSSKVADILKHQHPKPHRLRSVLGLEAKNAGILLPDADLDHAVSECVLGSLSFNGQRCTALKVLFVHRSILDAFLERFIPAVDACTLGMPWTDGVTVTPVADVDHAQFLHDLVVDATEQGASILNARDGVPCETLLAPTVVGPVTSAMRLYREEQFGPVIPIVPFETIDEPIEYLVTSDHGQQVSLFGSDPEQVGALIDPLVNQVCRVNLNSQCQRGPDTFPFTGRKDSAEGTLSVSDALKVFSIRTLVAAKGTEANKTLVGTIIHERQSNFLSTDFIF